MLQWNKKACIDLQYNIHLQYCTVYQDGDCKWQKCMQESRFWFSWTWCKSIRNSQQTWHWFSCWCQSSDCNRNSWSLVWPIISHGCNKAVLAQPFTSADKLNIRRTFYNIPPVVRGLMNDDFPAAAAAAAAVCVWHAAIFNLWMFWTEKLKEQPRSLQTPLNLHIREAESKIKQIHVKLYS